MQFLRFWLQAVEEFLGLDAKLLLETGGEVARIVESDIVGEVTDAQIRILLCHATGFLHADVADEG